MSNRWAAFSDDELRTIWDEIRMDDGIAYGVTEDDAICFRLLSEIRTEARSRGLLLPDEDWTV